MCMHTVSDLLATLGIKLQDISHSSLSPHDRLDRLSAEEIRELGRIASPNMIKRQDTSLGEMLPGLLRYRSQPLARASLKVRSYHMLRRAGVATWGDMVDLTPRQLSMFQNVGMLAIIDIVTCSVEKALHSYQTGDPTEECDSEDLDGELEKLSEFLTNEGDPAEAALANLRNFGTWGINFMNSLDALRSLAAWGIRERGAERLGDLLELKEDSKIWDEFSQIVLDDLADPVLLNITLDDLVGKFLMDLSVRERNVYWRRVIEGATLAEVSKEHGVARQRILQLQQRAESRLFHALQRSRVFDLLRWRAADLRASLGVTAPVGHAITRLALEKSLRGASAEFVELLRPLVLHLAGPFQERDGWITLEQATIPDSIEIKDLANEFGVLLLADAYKILAACAIRSEFHDAWLDHSGWFRRAGEHLMVWSRNVVDKSVALLAVRGKPADADTLVTLVGEGHRVSGARARFFEDKRLMRVNRTDWALRAWGLEEYTGITDEIAQRIEEGGGQAVVNDVVNEIVRLFNVKKNSVVMYTMAPMFCVEHGCIRLRRGDEPFKVGGNLELCTGAFRSSERIVSLLIPVDADLLRGSGRALRGPVAAVLGVVPGQPRSFSYADGGLNVTWPMTSAMGPSLGSVRVLVENVGALEGDRVRLDFDIEQRRVTVERVPRELSSYENDEAIRLLTGISTDLNETLDAVAQAIDTSPANVRYALQKRGDNDLVSLLPLLEIDPQLEATLSDLARMISQR